MVQKEVEKALNEAGIRSTRIREEILSVLFERGFPVSHSDISGHERLRDFDRVTLYRNLNLLLERNVVHAVLGMDGSWRYCAHPETVSGCPGGHAHFLCMSCGRMYCLYDQPIPYVEVPEGFDVKAKQLVVYGKCRECREKEGNG